MKIIKTLEYLALLPFLVAIPPSLTGQSSAFVYGDLWYGRDYAIDELRGSGLSTLIVYNLHVANNGDLSLGYHQDHTYIYPGGPFPLVRDGVYVGHRYFPHFQADLTRLKTAPTSIDRIEFCIHDGHEVDSYKTIRDFHNAGQLGPGSVLYRNFAALKEALPELDAINNNSEATYHQTSKVAFAKMLAGLGYKNTISPFNPTNANWWKDVAVQVNEEFPGNFDRNYLQVYAGGSGNNPCSDIWDWDEVSMFPGLYFRETPESLETKLQSWKDECGIRGGYYWIYSRATHANSDQTKAFADAMNTVFGGGENLEYTPVLITDKADSAFSVHTADLDGDGDMDVLSASANDDKIVWYENLGGTYFYPHVISRYAEGARSVYAADLDRDGDIDVLSASHTTNKIAWYENDGTGNFPNRNHHFISTSAGGATSVYAADIDGDKDLDVLSASAYDNKIAWYENTGQQGADLFNYQSASPSANQNVISIHAEGARSVYAADLDRDGDIDVLSASHSSNKIAWYENDGTGNFPNSNHHFISTSAEGAQSVYTADLDGDGDLDVLSASENDDKIAWYKNDGAGNFGEEETISAYADGARSVYTADMDNDGDPDVLSASSGDNKIAWYENNGQGSFPNHHFISTTANHARSVYAADLDGDGDMDALSASVGDDKIAWYVNRNDDIHFRQRRLSGTDWWKVSEGQSVMAADMDGDGDMDVLSTLYNQEARNESKITWYENREANNMQEHVIIFTEEIDGQPRDNRLHVVRAAYAADLDGDGDQDVLSASYGNNKIAWYKNLDGEGDFIGDLSDNQRTISTAANGARSVHAADLDGDEDMDVLSASENDNKIAWYENLGDDDFGEQQTISIAAEGASSVFTADLDGDGDMDVLSASYLDDTIAWYQNDGLGHFGEQRIISTRAEGARSVYVSDLDGDGDPDVLSASYLDDTIAWYPNDGAGNFGEQRAISSTATGASSVYTTDMDGDGDPDVLSASYAFSNEVYKIAWYENDGIGNFGAPQTISTTADGATSVQAADLDQDGDEDVFSASVGENISWYINNLEKKPRTVIPLSPLPNTIDVAEDTNSEVRFSYVPDPDSITTSSFQVSGEQSGPMEGRLTILGRTVNFHPEQSFMAGERVSVTITQALQPAYTWSFRIKTAPIPHDLQFEEARIGTAADGVTSVYASDLDKDGDLDVLLSSSIDDKIAWYENDGLGNFGEQRTISADVDGARSVHTGDLDGDGNMDVLSASASDDKIAWYRNIGTGSFGEQRIISTEVDGTQWVHTADLDRDGDLDVLSASYTDNKIAWYENDGQGGFGEQKVISTEADGASLVRTDDLDGDGDMDVLSASLDDNTIAWYKNDGQGHFGEQRIISTEDDGVRSVHVGDLDGDGDRDVLSASYVDDTIAWYENDGLGHFREQRIISTEADGASSVHLGDLDGDGDLDVLSASSADDKIAWYENDGTGHFGEQKVISTQADGSRSVLTGDLDGDGDLDVLSASSLDGKIAWYMNNRLPRIAAEMPDQLVDRGFKTHTLALDGVFADEDGHALRLSAVSDREEVVTVAVSGDGSQLQLTETGPGIADITLTADDGHGGVATDVFFVAVVTEGNHPPTVVAEIPDQELRAGFKTHHLELGDVFGDPDGHDLELRVVSANTEVVRAGLSGDGTQLVLTEVGTGVTDIMVRAEDGHGGRAVEVFLVAVMTPGNHPPTVVAGIPDQELRAGFGTHNLELGGVFADADGHDLTFAVASANTDMVRAGLSGDGTQLVLTEMRAGVTDITVSAEDGHGGRAVDVFLVTVGVEGNRPPEVASPIADQQMNTGFGTYTIPLEGVFADKDGNDLRLDALSGNEKVVAAEVSGTQLTLLEKGSGTADITVSADDGYGGKISDVFLATVMVPQKSALDLEPTMGLSPNSDGINDTWVIKNISEYPQALVKVFDRNGMEVFSTRDYHNDWGGTKDGTLLPAGAYYYHIAMADAASKQLSGWIYINY